MFFAPLPDDAAKGDEAAARFAALGPEAQTLFAGAAGCSPYLNELLRKHEDWILANWGAAAVPADIFVDISDLDVAAAEAALRQAKGRLALFLGLHDLGGTYDQAQVTRALSDFASWAVQGALAVSIRDLAARGRLKHFQAADHARACGIFIIAMGKLGAHELNYSSDIDLIAMFDDRDLDDEAYFAARKDAVAITQAMARMLSQNTGDGYVFRTDLRLRPDPAVTPVCVGMSAAERYYESLGRTWERAAFIKARVIAGDMATGAEFLDGLRPFVWRRYLDFAAIHQTQDMLTKIRHHKGLTGPITWPAHNVKLGRGGIREIEFFAQTQQLIFGGRTPGLQVAGTCAALDELAREGRITKAKAQDLADCYAQLRTLEHRLQMLEDAQTHEMPQHQAGMARLARFSGYQDADEFAAKVLALFEQVHGATALFPDTPDAPAQQIEAETRTRWLALPVLKNEQARALFASIEPRLAVAVSATHDPEASLRALDRFVTTLPAGVQLFSLFEARPKLLDLLVEICGTTPDLAHYLARNSQVFDAVLDAAFFGPLPQETDYQTALAALMPDDTEYEAGLNAVRRWKKEAHFQVGVHLLRNISTPAECAAAYSAIATVALAVLLRLVRAYMEPGFGPPPGGGLAVISMGKLGSMEMTAGSDLDLIVVYDADPQDMTNAPKPLFAGAYYGKFTQRLIAALTSATGEGVLYEVDLRLRPSGRKGPVATSMESFSNYQLNDAWTWEHLALSRAQVSAGDAAPMARASAAIAAALTKPRDWPSFWADVIDMRRRIASAKPGAGDAWDVKAGPGGMLDIELFVQSFALHAGVTAARPLPQTMRALVQSGDLQDEIGDRLGQIYRRFAQVQHGMRLAGLHSPANHAGAARLIARLAGEIETMPKAKTTPTPEDQANIAQIEAELASDKAWARDHIGNLLENMRSLS